MSRAVYKKQNRWYSDVTLNGIRTRESHKTAALALLRERQLRPALAAGLTIAEAAVLIRHLFRATAPDGYSRGQAPAGTQLNHLVKSHGSIKCQQLDAPDIHDYIRLHWQAHTGTGLYSARAGLRRALWALGAYGVRRECVEALPRYARPMPRTYVVTDAQRDQMLAHAKPALRFVIACCAYMGTRHSTARQFAPRHMVPSATGPRIVITTKHKDVLDLPIPEQVMQLISLAPVGGDPDISYVRRFVGHGNGHKGLAPSWLAKEFAKLKQQLNLPQALRIHDLRRTAALAVYGKTRSLYAVKELLGVRTLNAALIYLHAGKYGITAKELETLYGTN